MENVSITVDKKSSQAKEGIIFEIKNNFEKPIYLQQQMFYVFSLKKQRLDHFVPILLYDPMIPGTPALLALKEITIGGKKSKEITWSGKMYAENGLALEKNGVYKIAVAWSFEVDEKSSHIAVAKPPFTTIESKEFHIR